MTDRPPVIGIADPPRKQVEDISTAISQLWTKLQKERADLDKLMGTKQGQFSYSNILKQIQSISLSSLGLSVNAPITMSPSHRIGLDYNTTNLQISGTILNTIQDIDTTATPQFAGLLIGVNAFSGTELMRIYQDSAGVVPQLLVEQDGAGDAAYSSLLTGGAQCSWGIDNSDSDRWRLNFGAALGANAHVVLDSNGNLGLGIPVGTTMYRELMLYNGSSSTVVAQWVNSTTGTGQNDGFIVGIDSNEAAILWQYENDYMYFGTNDTERLRIHADGDMSFIGDFIIGETLGANPGYKLDVQKSVAEFIAVRLGNLDPPGAGELTQSVSIEFDLYSTDSADLRNCAKILAGKDGSFVNPTTDIDGNLQFYTALNSTLTKRFQIYSSSDFRFLYDDTHYANFTVESDGDLLIDGYDGVMKVGIGKSPDNDLSVAGGIDSSYLCVGTTALLGTELVNITLANDAATAGPIMILDRNSSSPAASDFIGAINFYGRNSIGGSVRYASITGGIRTATSGTEDGDLYFYVADGGNEEVLMLKIGDGIFAYNVKFGADQAGAGAAANEIWKTNGHETLPDNVLMIGV